MKRILQLENELKLNKEKYVTIMTNSSPESLKEQRLLMLQRSNLKDLLLEEYRKVTNVSSQDQN